MQLKVTYTGNANFICKQYEIVLIFTDFNLDESIKNGPKEILLAILLSPDPINKYLDHVEVAPLHEVERNIPTRVELSCTNESTLEKTMYVALERKTTISSRRIISKVGDITDEEKEKIKNVLKQYYKIE